MSQAGKHVAFLLVAARPGAHEEAAIEGGKQAAAFGTGDGRAGPDQRRVRAPGVLAAIVQHVLDRAAEDGHG